MLLSLQWCNIYSNLNNINFTFDHGCAMTMIIALIVGLPFMVILAACAASNQQEIDADVNATLSASQPTIIILSPTPRPAPAVISPNPTSPILESETCRLTGGEIVQKGWSGKDTGFNSCNQCRCMQGGLACTKMACSPIPATNVITLKIGEVLTNIPDYDRKDWKHWLDEDGDCQNARHEVLIHESLIAVTFKDDQKCQVASGQWHDPYINDTIADATKLDVDHMVPLKNAHDSGGWAWDKKRKSEYANYMKYEDHLIAVTASANRKKGAKGPDEWKPSNKEHWCDYATDWIEIKVQWDLSATKSEWSALEEMIRTCEQPLSITPVASQMKVPTPEPISKPAPVKPTEVSKSVSLMNVQITALDCKGKPETLVITNAGDSQQDMTGWTIVDEGAKHTFNFPNRFILDPGLTVEVVSGSLGDDTNSILYWKKQTVWNNDGDTASVLDSTGRIIGTMDCP